MIHTILDYIGYTLQAIANYATIMIGSIDATEIVLGVIIVFAVYRFVLMPMLGRYGGVSDTARKYERRYDE